MTLRETLTARVTEVVAQAERTFGWKWDSPIEVKLDLRGRNLGQALFRRVHGIVYRTIRLNLQAAEQDLQYMLEQTIPHEVAHHAEHRAYSRMSHSPTWRSMFRALGGSGDRIAKAFNGVTTKARRTRKFVYVLPVYGRAPLKRSSHDRIMAGMACTIRSTGERITALHFSHEELI